MEILRLVGEALLPQERRVEKTGRAVKERLRRRMNPYLLLLLLSLLLQSLIKSVLGHVLLVEVVAQSIEGIEIRTGMTVTGAINRRVRKRAATNPILSELVSLLVTLNIVKRTGRTLLTSFPAMGTCLGCLFIRGLPLCRWTGRGTQTELSTVKIIVTSWGLAFVSRLSLVVFSHNDVAHT